MLLPTAMIIGLEGENVQVKRLPTGFTTKGIVALVFSCVVAFLGLFTISFYGMNDIAHVEDKVARDLDIDLEAENEDEEEAVVLNQNSSSLDSNSKPH